MNNASRDAGIPILTEIIDTTPDDAGIPETDEAANVEGAAFDTSFSSAPATAGIESSATPPSQHRTARSFLTAPAGYAAPATVEALENQAVTDWNDDDWNRLERKMRERILRQILGRVDSVLDQRVRDSLADVLQTAVEHVASDLRTALQQNLEEMVARAISQEITRLQAPKK